MRNVTASFGFLATLALLSSAGLCACPNAATSVTIPLSGAALVTICDQDGNLLPGTGSVVQQQMPTLANWNSVTAPGFTADAAGIHLIANGAVPGLAGTFKVTYPGGQQNRMDFIVGAPVTAISFGTTTP